jgi:hypothetical protein
VRGPGNGPVDAGELTAVFFVPLPDGGGGVGGGHEGIQTRGKADCDSSSCFEKLRPALGLHGNLQLSH